MNFDLDSQLHPWAMLITAHPNLSKVTEKSLCSWFSLDGQHSFYPMLSTFCFTSYILLESTSLWITSDQNFVSMFLEKRKNFVSASVFVVQLIQVLKRIGMQIASNVYNFCIDKNLFKTEF